MKILPIIYCLLISIMVGGSFIFIANLSETTYQKNETPEFDYIIDLKQDEIRILTEEGKYYSVHPDSLNEFIIQDNL